MGKLVPTLRPASSVAADGEEALIKDPAHHTNPVHESWNEDDNGAASPSAATKEDGRAGSLANGVKEVFVWGVNARRLKLLVSSWITLLILCLAQVSSSEFTGHVALLRTPDEGIQPQGVVDDAGVVHLIYYKGDPAGGDIFYVHRPPGQEDFSNPIRVNKRAGSATALGSIRGAQLAVGKNGRVHVAWNGHAPEKGTYLDAPMLYTRLNDSGTGFETERNLITSAKGLDGGGTVAADREGNVYVFWHASKPGDTNGEAGRAVFVARSTDEGETFAPEKLATAKPTGACACCGMKAFADSRGNLFALYRGASDMVNRDEILLMSNNHAEHFTIISDHPWKLSSCPMSSAFLSESQADVLAAAETQGRVYFVRVDPSTGKVSAPVSPEAQGKHPVAVANGRGEVLLVWLEGTGWAKGGKVAWQIYGKDGEPTPQAGRADGVPPWSLAAAIAEPTGNFAIIY